MQHGTTKNKPIANSVFPRWDLLQLILIHKNKETATGALKPEHTLYYSVLRLRLSSLTSMNLALVHSGYVVSWATLCAFGGTVLYQLPSC